METGNSNSKNGRNLDITIIWGWDKYSIMCRVALPLQKHKVWVFIERRGGGNTTRWKAHGLIC